MRDLISFCAGAFFAAFALLSRELLDRRPMPPEIRSYKVRVLQRVTGAGTAECARALLACGGDFDKAAEWLTRRGQA